MKIFNSNTFDFPIAQNMETGQQKLFGNKCKEALDTVMLQIVRDFDQRNEPLRFNAAFRDGLVTLASSE